MFEVGFSEIIVIVVVALIVIGPEKLPKLARTYGLLYGRVQRYVSGIKQDMEREVALDQMKKATAEAQQKLLAFQAKMLTLEGEAEVISELPLTEMVAQESAAAPAEINTAKRKPAKAGMAKTHPEKRQPEKPELVK